MYASEECNDIESNRKKIEFLHITSKIEDDRSFLRNKVLVFVKPAKKTLRTDEIWDFASLLSGD